MTYLGRTGHKYTMSKPDTLDVAKRNKGNQGSSIICTTTGKPYTSITEASNDLKISRGAISTAIIQDKPVKGLQFRKL